MSKERSNSIMELKFKKNWFGRWYIDLPQYLKEGGKKADLEMVAGADTMLDYIGRGKRRVKLRVSEEPNFPYAIHLFKHEEDDCGATYFNSEVTDQTVWLCNVTKYVFGGYHPEDIYVDAY